MAIARARCVALIGVEGFDVHVECHISSGLPAFHIVGLPDTTLREARDRIRAAVDNSDVAWPNRRITVSLSPAGLPKAGSVFDLSIAVSVLAASGAVPAAAVADQVFLGELGLDGRVRAVPGVLPAVLASVSAGRQSIVVARSAAAEAAMVPGARITAVGSLGELLGLLRGDVPAEAAAAPTSGGADDAPAEDAPAGDRADRRAGLDMADVIGQPVARHAAEIAAAGGHHMWLLGAPGTGKTMLAERLPSLLPRLEVTEALEVSAIRSVAGLLSDGGSLVRDPPFCDPHHTATRAAIVGGGSSVLRPGAASLAHRGVLFVDEAPEFGAGVLDALRQPLESGEIVVARAATTARFPARFLLLMAANPCPCANAGAGGPPCTCTPAARRGYLAKISGPLRDRVDLKIRMDPPTRTELFADRGRAESSRRVAERVAAARRRGAHRLRGTPWRTNAQVPGRELRRSYAPPAAALDCLEAALRRGELSARGVDKTVRVAWTLADLAGRAAPNGDDTAFALALWLGMPV